MGPGSPTPEPTSQCKQTTAPAWRCQVSITYFSVLKHTTKKGREPSGNILISLRPYLLSKSGHHALKQAKDPCAALITQPETPCNHLKYLQSPPSPPSAPENQPLKQAKTSCVPPGPKSPRETPSWPPASPSVQPRPDSPAQAADTPPVSGASPPARERSRRRASLPAGPFWSRSRVLFDRDGATPRGEPHRVSPRGRYGPGAGRECK